MRYLFNKKIRVIGLCVAVVALLAVGHAVFGLESGVITDNFDTYDTGVLPPQGDWGWYGSNKNWNVSDGIFHGESGKSITPDGAGQVIAKINAVHSFTGVQSLYIYLTNSISGTPTIYLGMTGKYATYPQYYDPALFYCGFRWTGTQWNFGSYDGGGGTGWLDITENTSLITWHLVQIKFDWDAWEFQCQLDGGAWNEARGMSPAWGAAKANFTGQINGVQFSLESQTSAVFYIDDVGDEQILEPYIEGITPASESEITDLDTNLTIGYHYFDWNTYKGFVINFRDLKLGATGNSKQFLAEDLDPSGTGTEVINLQDFGIDTNGVWYLTGLGFGSALDIEGGMYLTTRGYVDFWSDEMVLDPYSLVFNVEGLPSPYTFTDSEDWYTTNVERFDTPTTFFTSFVGVVAPIFEKVSDFGLRIQPQFDKTQAYDRGYALGEIFPLINGYIQKIDLFFGGFPLASFFIYAILTMIAIFIIRMVMKFIPFIGK